MKRGSQQRGDRKEAGTRHLCFRILRSEGSRKPRSHEVLSTFTSSIFTNLLAAAIEPRIYHIFYDEIRRAQTGGEAIPGIDQKIRKLKVGLKALSFRASFFLHIPWTLHPPFNQTYLSLSPTTDNNMRNKPRLHLALYARPKHPDTYHYALLIRPKPSNAPAALKFHVHNKLQKTDDLISQPWLYETIDIPDVSLEPRLLACIAIEKILVPLGLINQILREVPIQQTDDPSGQGKAFDCVKWLQLAIPALRRADAVSNNGFTWDGIREEALRYMRRKKQEKRWEVGWKGGRQEDVATFDMLTGEEVVP